jgi:hypothetical protein
VFRPKRFALEAMKEVDYCSARRFQLGCCSLAWIVLSLGICPVIWQRLHLDEGEVADIFVIAALAVGLFLWLLMSSGIPSYFCHPRSLDVDLQDRAIAASYYCCAPLSLTPLAGFLTAAAWLPLDFEWIDRMSGGLIVLGAAGWMLIAIELAVVPALLLQNGLHVGTARVTSCLLVQIFGWPFLLIAWAGGLPLAVVYLQIVVPRICGCH